MSSARNVAIEHRWAENQIDRLQELAAELVRRQITVIAATTASSALAVKVHDYLSLAS